MYYVTVMQSPMYHQITLDEFLFGDKKQCSMISSNTANTRTYSMERISDKLYMKTDVIKMLSMIKNFNNAYAYLRDVEDRHSLYYEFYIPKKSGGLRKIDAPEEDLMGALRTLKAIFEEGFYNKDIRNALYHTSAFAYVKNRSTLDAVKRHQNNESKWYGKLDFSNFFGSTTLDFTMSQFKKVYPFCVLCEAKEGEEELRKALELAFLDGGLPQGTPISPLITNIIMIPIDHVLANGFRNFENQNYVYTRYADDMIISSRYDFDINQVIGYIDGVLKEFDAPFRIKPEKTRYGSSAGRNWNLGLMVTADNKITIGSKKKRQFEAMLSSFVLDTQNGKRWPYKDIQVLDGYRNYYKSVEGEVIDRIIEHIGNKYNVNIPRLIKDQLAV